MNKIIGLNLSFILQVDPEIKHVLLGDETRLRQVLINLIGNAIKFTEKGSIQLTVSLIAENENKQVLQLLSNAHYTEADPLPIYSFLTELQAQDKREHFGFKWGDTLTNEAYLPRVMYKNIIFSLATWKISRKELSNIKDKETLDKWLFEKNIPEKVTISDLDNNLMIDFKNELSCKMFISIIKNREYLILKEFLYNKNKSLIKRDGEGFSNEFVLSFYKN